MAYYRGFLSFKYVYKASFTAQTFNSGIFATGSRVEFVSLLAAASAKWNGIKTVPGTAIDEILTFADIFPLLENTVTDFPSERLYFSASSPETST